ncbi:MAG TPA: hypothetical protein VFT99_12135 [Roseiflexaceae bacterium]|nr:hypothetical protein [Roseiflexaceae bacterium]
MTHYQTTLDTPQTDGARQIAIEKLGWRRLPDEGGVTVWWRNGVERQVPEGALAGWLSQGCPEKAEPSVLEVEAAIQAAGTITRHKLKAALAKRYDVSGLAAMVDEAIQDGFIEETDAGLVLVDRI